LNGSVDFFVADDGENFDFVFVVLYQKGIFIFLYAIRRKVDILGLTSFPGGITFGVIRLRK